MRYKLVITPALPGKKTKLVDDFLETIGYRVCGGGVFEDGSSSIIRFEGDDDENESPVYQKIKEKAR